MSLKYFFSTFLLLFVVALLGIKNYEVWTQPIEGAAENELTRKQRKDLQAAPIVMGSQKEKNSIASYILIAEKNIFNPERKDFPVAPVEQNTPRVRPQIILHGVAVSEDYQAASITNPGRPLRKGERETLTVKIGEKIGEYKLSKVLPDRIILEDTNDSFEVLLYDPKMPKKRALVQTENKPAAIISATPAPSQGSGTAEAPKPVPPKEAQGRGTAQGRAAPSPTPSASTIHRQEKTSVSPLSSTPMSPSPPPTASPPLPSAMSPLAPPTATPLSPPPAAKKLDPIYPTKIPVQGAPGK
jgi:hypothetical protein